MVKRKISSGDVSCKITKKTKKASESTEHANGKDRGSKLEFTKENVLSSLIKPTKLDNFWKTHWEKKPLYIKRSDSSFYGDLFSLNTMKEMLADEELYFETDVNVCRYINGEKEILNEENEQITVDKFDSLMKEKQATFQFHQPQRYSDVLWNLQEKLETYFGSLVGSNVYITPANAQGLAPHCDDVEIFVLQLEGKKTWKLYKPMVELSRDYTQDLDQATIGDPILEETLEPGDLLYLPRGTIHQAKSYEDGHSTHITISTYQQHTWGDFMNHVVIQAIENALEDDVSIRSGLPINCLSYLGTARNLSKYIEEDNKIAISNENEDIVKQFKENIQKHLLNLSKKHIDVNKAADAMFEDFVSSRLPPYGHVIKEDEDKGKVPTLDSQIKIRFPDHVRVVYCDEDAENVETSQLEESDADDSDTEIEEDEKPANGNETVKKEKSTDKGKTSLADSGKTQSKSPKKDSKRKAVKPEADEDEDYDDEYAISEEEPCVKIYHSLNNDRTLHMGGADETCADGFTGILKVPVHFGRAAVSLTNANDFVLVKDLALDDDDDKIKLATTLYADDLIEVK